MLRSWWQDKLLRGVLKNSSYLFSSNSLAAILGMVNSIFATRLLGVEGLGLVATIQTFTSNINRLLSFRMSEVVVKYLGQALASQEAETDAQPAANNPQAAAVVKGIALLDIGTSSLAYLVGKTFAGVAVSILAFRQMDKSLGGSWWRTSLRLVDDWRGVLSFAVNTNLNGTVNLLTRDNAPLYLAALSPTNAAQANVGYFKLGLSIINFVTLPIDPFIWPTYAEITRTIALRQWKKTRQLLRRVSSIAGAWTLSATAGIALLGWWLIPLVYGPGTSPVYPVVLILLIGYGTANILHWNRPLLLALGKPSYPLLIALAVGFIEVLLVLWLVPPGGHLAMAAILSGYLAASVILIAWRGWRLIRQHEALDSQRVEANVEDIHP